MGVKPGWTRKRRHTILLGVFVLLGLLAGAGYAVLKPPVLTSSAVVVLPSSTHYVATQAVVADSDPVLARALWSIRPAVSLPALHNRIRIKSLTTRVLAVTAQGKTAAEAEGAANAVANSYVAYVNGGPRSVEARMLQPAVNATGSSRIGHLLLMGGIGALVGLLIGAIVALAVSRSAPTTPAPAA